MKPPCACGARICHKRNHGFFRERKPGKKIRAVVFWWDSYRCWTWCPVINGEPVDHGTVMGHFDTLQLAYAEARGYTCGEYREALS